MEIHFTIYDIIESLVTIGTYEIIRYCMGYRWININKKINSQENV